MDAIKGLIKNTITARMDKSFDSVMEKKDLSYDAWIREKEQNLQRIDMRLDAESAPENREGLSYSAHAGGSTFRIIPYEKVGEKFSISAMLEDIIVFVNGELTDRALPLLAEKFSKNQDYAVVYGDEDLAELDTNAVDRYGRSIYGTRRDPYFKPDWSPNAFLSRFYFGNIVAIRRSAFREVTWSEGYLGARSIYHTLLRFLTTNEYNLLKTVGHVDEILVHAYDYDNVNIKDDTAYRLSCRMNVSEQVRKLMEGTLSLDHPVVVSVIIPSKDNSKLLNHLITSLYDACPGTVSLDIIVVDNGSSPSEKNAVEVIARRYPLRYFYKEMPFNFSLMCNFGAKEAKGEFLWFLNDDVLLTQPGTIEALLEQANFKFTGAVGAKLLYPDSHAIQHAGIINNRIGPVHKLQFKDDKVSYYHGFNRYTQNVIAVTGACLMIRKDVYEKVGGMSDELRVAFNDVDLCYKLYEAGFFNVVRNDISMEHRESVSRGKDTDADSLLRLLHEKERLYDMHTGLRAKDPYYSKYLLSDCLDSRMVPANEYEYRSAMSYHDTAPEMDLSDARLEECISLSLEFAGALRDFTYESDPDDLLFVQGFAYVSGSDNACYKKYILFSNEHENFAFSYEGVIRHDVEEACPDEKNVAMSGFACSFAKDMLPKGRYRVGVCMEHRFANEKLYVYSNRYLTVE